MHTHSLYKGIHHLRNADSTYLAHIFLLPRVLNKKINIIGYKVSPFHTEAAVVVLSN